MQGASKDWPSIVAADGTLLARTYGPNAVDDARTMNAAPALLEALEAIITDIAGTGTMPLGKHIEAGRAAIAAAKGETFTTGQARHGVAP